MKLNKLPYWVLSGIVIFPLLFFVGLILFVFTQGKVNYLFWFVIPSMIFKDLSEMYLRFLLNSQTANIIFVIIFWFSIGAFLNWVTDSIKKL